MNSTQSRIRLVASGMRSLEAPVFGADGTLMFTDLKSGLVYALEDNGEVNVVTAGWPHAGGMCLHGSGGLVLSGSSLVHYREGGKRTLLDPDDVGDVAAGVVGFNDLAADVDGTVIAGAFIRDERDGTIPGALVRVTAARTCELVFAGIHPNGVAPTPSGLIVAADTYGRRLVWLDPEGGSTPVRQVDTSDIPGLPDGLAVDVDGCTWMAFYRGAVVVHFDPDGRVLEVIDLPASKPLSVCLHPERPELYVTTGEDGSETGCVYVVEVAAPGQRVHAATV